MIKNFKETESFIFDMDGTIVDSSEAMCKSINFVRKNIGLKPVAKEFLEYHINKPDENLPMIFYETPEYKKEHREMFKKHYLENAPKYIKLYDGIEEVLGFLSKKSKMYVATNAYDYFAINMLESLGIADFFDMVVGANCVKKPKPDAEMINMILKKGLHVKEKTVFVGDSTKDMLSAKNAGVEFIYAKWGYCEFDYEGIKTDSPRDIISLFDL